MEGTCNLWWGTNQKKDHERERTKGSNKGEGTKGKTKIKFVFYL